MFSHFKIPNEKESMRRVAIHEASHAVAAFCKGVGFDYITIDPENKYAHLGYLGYIAYASNPRNDFDFLIVNAAGYYGEQIEKTGHEHISEGAHIDFEMIDKAIIAKYGHHKLTEVHREIMEKTNDLLLKNFDKVRTLARALEESKTLTFNEVKKLLQ